MDESKDIVSSAFRHVAEQAVRDVVARHVGSGIDSDVKQAIRAEAMRIIKEDAEVSAAIRKRMMYWIAQS